MQSDLIRSVQDVSEYFSKSDREFSDAILMIQTEREQITQSLAVTDRWFQGEALRAKRVAAGLQQMRVAFFQGYRFWVSNSCAYAMREAVTRAGAGFAEEGPIGFREISKGNTALCKKLLREVFCESRKPDFFPSEL